MKKVKGNAIDVSIRCYTEVCGSLCKWAAVIVSAAGELRHHAVQLKHIVQVSQHWTLIVLVNCWDESTSCHYSGDGFLRWKTPSCDPDVALLFLSFEQNRKLMNMHEKAEESNPPPPPPPPEAS